MKYLDLSFDPLFQARDHLKWWPWVGSDFARTSVKTMILGESVYRWSRGEAFDKRYALTSALRETHSDHALDFDRNSRYVRNIERAIFQRRNPSDTQKQALWSSVAYHNLVLDAMQTVRHRPNQEQYQKGWDAALDLFDMLGVEQCLVFGVDAYFGERDRRFRERDRFGKVGRCAVLIVDFLASFGRVLVPARWASEMVF